MKIQHLLGKVKPRPVFLASVLLAGTALWTGCGKETGEDEAMDEASVTDRDKFGDPYEIVTNFNQAEPDFMPQLLQDTLAAKITYTGGCDDHDFDLHHEVASDTARLWLRHGDSGDDCTERIQDELRLKLPEEVVQAPVIVLLNPQGGRPFMVKWGR